MGKMRFLHEVQVHKLFDKVKAGFLIILGLFTQVNNADALFSTASDELKRRVYHRAQLGRL
jgi:hypothetical protein